MANPYSSDPHTTWELARVLGLSARYGRALHKGDHATARSLERRIDEIGRKAAEREARRV